MLREKKLHIKTVGTFTTPDGGWWSSLEIGDIIK
jgi:hypothetical protein